MAEDFEGGPGVSAFVAAGPGFGQVAQEGVEGGWGVGEKRDGVREVVIHGVRSCTKVAEFGVERKWGRGEMPEGQSRLPAGMTDRKTKAGPSLFHPTNEDLFVGTPALRMTTLMIGGVIFARGGAGVASGRRGGSILRSLRRRSCAGV